MNDLILFWKRDDEYGCFSQWYEAPFTVEGIRYWTCEQYMMARKALLFHDHECYKQIMKERDPAKVKALGRTVRNFDSAVWKKHNEEVIYTANYAKFSQNPRLKAILLKTAGCSIAEASPLDKVYGIGLDEFNPDAWFPARWRGQNLLGKALEKVRDALSLKERSNTDAE